MNKMTAIWVAAAVMTGSATQAETLAPVVASTTAKKVLRCPPTTGTRLSRAPNADGSCDTLLPDSRSYSREDMERTGQANLGQALPRLDPSITSR